jgi:hypothetical protein
MPAFRRRVSTAAASVEPSRRWRNARSVEERRDFRAHEFEEHTNAPSAVEMHESTKNVGEWPRQNANLLANLEVGVEANRSGAFGRRHQRLDNALRHGDRLVDSHDQRGDAEGAVDATPLVPRKIKNKENIAGEKRRQNVAQFASVPDGAPQSRSETPEAQAMEVELCSAFAMGVHARDKPTLPWLQIESPRKGSKLRVRALFNDNAIQHRRLLMDGQSIC